METTNKISNLILIVLLTLILLVIGNYFLGKDKPRIEKRETLYVDKKPETKENYVIPNCVGEDGLEDLTCQKG